MVIPQLPLETLESLKDDLGSPILFGIKRIINEKTTEGFTLDELERIQEGVRKYIKYCSENNLFMMENDALELRWSISVEIRRLKSNPKMSARSSSEMKVQKIRNSAGIARRPRIVIPKTSNRKPMPYYKVPMNKVIDLPAFHYGMRKKSLNESNRAFDYDKFVSMDVTNYVSTGKVEEGIGFLKNLPEPERMRLSGPLILQETAKVVQLK